MKTKFLIILFVIPSLALSQENEYKYSYRLNLPDKASFHYLENITTNTEVSHNSIQSIKIELIDESEDPIYTDVIIVKANGDKLMLFPDDDGIINTDLKYDNYNIIVNHPPYSLFDENISLSSKTKRLTIVLGRSFKLVIPIIKSKRPLTNKELIKLAKQISNGNKKPKLIKKGICTLIYEI